MAATPPVSAGGAADPSDANDVQFVSDANPGAGKELSTNLSKFWYALGLLDGAQQAFHREPSDNTAKLRDLAVVRLARAKRDLLGERS
jgi:hypothetical protein